MTITLFKFRPGFGVPCPSPFCMKAEVLLLMSGLSFQSKIIDDPRKGPKGKLPFIKDGDIEVADSSLIQGYLESQYQVDFDGHLSEQEKAIAHAFGRMIEERLYWVLVYSRWIDPNNWQQVSKFWFGDLPPVVKNVLPMVVQRQIKKDLHSHGLGRHDADSIYEFGKADIQALSDLLGDKAFMLGKRPSGLDASAFAMIANVLSKSTPNPLSDYAHTLDNLKPYAERCRQRWFPNFVA